MKQPDQTFITIAHTIAENSTCAKKKVGAVLVNNNRILSCGYNGTPSGLLHCETVFHPGLFLGDDKAPEDENQQKDSHRLWQDVWEIHAEQNAILDAAMRGVAILPGTICYVTHRPCGTCLKLLVGCSILQVYFDIENERHRNIDFLRKAAKYKGLKVERLAR